MLWYNDWTENEWESSQCTKTDSEKPLESLENIFKNERIPLEAKYNGDFCTVLYKSKVYFYLLLSSPFV